MSKENQLYSIIKALTRGEKRAFSIYASKYQKSNKNSILNLFGIVDQATNESQHTIQSKFEKKFNTKYTAVLKGKLLDSVITSLRQQNNHKNNYFTVNRYIEESKILFKRELFTLAHERITKAKKQAYSADKFHQLLEIIDVEKAILLRIVSNEQYITDSKRLYSEKQHLLILIENKDIYWQLSDELYYRYRKEGKNAKFEDLIDHKLIKDKSLALSKSAKNSYYFIRTISMLNSGKTKEALEAINQQIEVLTESKKFLLANIQQYIYVINNALYIYVQLNDEKPFFKLIEKLRNLVVDYSIEDIYVERRVFEVSYSMELDFYLKNFEISKANKIVQNIEAGILKFQKSGWSLARFMNMAFGLSLLYFYQGKIKESHYWIDEILKVEGLKMNHQTIAYSKILDLILYYEQKQYQYLLNQIANVKRYLSKYSKLHELDILFLKLLNDLTKEKNEPEYIQEFTTAFETCEASHTKYFYEQYLHILSWCQYKINNTSLLEEKELKNKI